MTGFSIAT